MKYFIFGVIAFCIWMVVLASGSGFRAPKEYNSIVIDAMFQRISQRISKLENRQKISGSDIIVSKMQPAVKSDGMIWLNPLTGVMKIYGGNTWRTSFLLEIDDSDDITEGVKHLFVSPGQDVKIDSIHTLQGYGFDTFASNAFTDTIVCSFDVVSTTYAILSYYTPLALDDSLGITYTLDISGNKIIVGRVENSSGAINYRYQIWEP